MQSNEEWTDSDLIVEGEPITSRHQSKGKTIHEGEKSSTLLYSQNNY